MKVNTILAFIFSILITGWLNAQNIEFVASAPNLVRVGEQFQVQFSVNASVDDFTPPSFDNFDYLGGPMQSTSASRVNGKTTRTTTFTLIYYLRAKNPGKFKFTPAKASYKNSEVVSNELEIEVVGTSSTPNESEKNTQSPAASSTGEEVFLSLVLDKKSAIVGEPITAWVKIYTKVSLTDFDRRNYKGPECSGFYRQEVEIPPLTNLEREKVGNDIYYSGVIQKMVLFPQKTGAIRIEPFNLDVFLQQQSRQSRSIIDEFFGTSYSSVQKTLTSRAVEVMVKQLPENMPAGFSGAIGNYSLKGSINSEQVRVNDAVTFKLVLNGTGNIKLVEKLNYDLSALETYDPVVKTTIDKSGLGGTKVFEITAIPRHAGTYTIKPFEFIYFDVVSKQYKTIKTQAFTLVATKTDADSSAVIISNLSKEDVELLGSDIRYIKTVTKLRSANSYFVLNYLYYIALLLMLLAFGLVLHFKRKQLHEVADIARSKNRKANKIAQKRLRIAEGFLKNDNKAQFYEELSKALWGYISDKLNIPLSALSTDKTKSDLITRGIDSEVADNLLEIISECEFARYAPGGITRPVIETYQLAVKLILHIEQKI